MTYKEIGAQALLDKSKLELLQLREVIERSDIVFVPIQTPHEKKFEGITRLPKERKGFYYGFLRQAMHDIADICLHIGKRKIVAVISTVLPGTIEREVQPVLNEYVQLCYCPHFIAMGTTIKDFLDPEFVLLGVDDKEAASVVEQFYRTLHSSQVFRTTVRTAELIKVAYNVWITSKICIANTIGEIAHKVGADADDVFDALALATNRIVSTAYMCAGSGDGGQCHPRDSIALSHLARRINLSYDWFEHLMLSRERQADWFADLIETEAKNRHLPVMMLGIAFKPGTNITTGSHAILVMNILKERNIEFTAYDPHVLGGLPIDKSVWEKPHVFFVSTRHPEFASISFAPGSVVIDPHRYIKNQPGVHVIRIGGGRGW